MADLPRVSYAEWQRLSDAAGRYLSMTQARALHDAGQTAANFHHAASWECASQGILGWLVLPKMHVGSHVDQDALSFCYNPRFWANWNGEDFMGSLKKICAGTNSRKMELRVLRQSLLRVHVDKR